MAQTAIYDADFVARNLVRKLRSKAQKPYVAKAPISVIPVGDRWAGAQWGNVLMYGLTGHILRHLADLIAYADIESWPRAAAVWLKDYRHEDNCPICESGGVQAGNKAPSS
jgi:NADH dehydrogenase FAD-containing subunit